MRKKPYRAIVVGCGKIGALFEAEPKRTKPASHAGAIVKNPETTLTAFVDTDSRALERASALFPDSVCYTSLAKCLAIETPDILIVATPPQERLRVVQAAARAGVKMIVCEKPLASGVKEAREIQKVISRSKITFVLNYQRRFSPLFARARSAIARNVLGRINQVTCYYSNGLRNNGGHLIDALLYLLDDPITSVRAVRNTKSGPCPIGDWNVDCMLETKRGTRIVLQSFDQRSYGIHDIRMFGEKGEIAITQFGEQAVRRKVRPSYFAGIKELNMLTGSEEHVALSATEGALQEMISCFELHTAPRSSLSNGIAVLQVLDAARESARRSGRSAILRS